MRILLVNGSARRDDACGEAARRTAERLEAGGAETAIFWPVKTKGLACSNCGACKGAGMCVADPRAGEFLKEAAAYDALLFFVPVGLLGPGVDARNFLLRVAELNHRRGGKPLQGKRAAAVPTGRRSARSEAQIRSLVAALGLEEYEG